MSAAKGKTHKSDSGIYIVTEDLSFLVPRTGKKLGIPKHKLQEKLDETFYRRILEELVHAINKHCFPNEPIEVRGLPHDFFCDLLNKYDEEAKGSIREFWVCLDTVYPKYQRKDNVYCLSISRYFDEKCYKRELFGPRPEDTREPIKNQVADCINNFNKAKKKNNGLRLVIIDDGAFGGKTIETVLNEFAEQNQFVEDVRLGVAKLPGIKVLCDWQRSSQDKKVHRLWFLGASKLCPPMFDWICERDFFPGILYAGNLICEKRGDVLQPREVGKFKRPVRAQYLDGWGNITTWASLKQGCPGFTYEALGLSIEIWDHLEKIRKKRIMVEELPAIPWKIYYKNGCLDKILREPWLDILKEEHKKSKKDDW